jgi:hypothetical protein
MKLILMLVLMLVSNLVHASSEAKPPVSDKMKWQSECGSCHVPYPPRLLAGDNWQQLIKGLNKHFGSNAMLEDKDSKEILGFLKRFAGNGERFSSPSLRISDTPWFKHEHRVISAKEWANPDVGSRSNCSACHGRSVLGS